jgi:hypothetical protein
MDFLQAESNWFFLVVVAIWVLSWWLEKKRKDALRRQQERDGVPSPAKTRSQRPSRPRPTPVRQRPRPAESPQGWDREEMDSRSPIPEMRGDSEKYKANSNPAYSYEEVGAGGRRSEAGQRQQYEVEVSRDERQASTVEDSYTLEEAEAYARNQPYPIVVEGRGRHGEQSIEDLLETLKIPDHYEEMEDIGVGEIGSDDAITDSEPEDWKIRRRAGTIISEPVAPRAQAPNFFAEHFPKGIESALIGKEILQRPQRQRRFRSKHGH